MKTYIEEFDVLLMRRIADGLYFWLKDYGSSSEWGWTEDKSKAFRVNPWDKFELENPKDCDYYFENSPRAKFIWCVDSVMEWHKIVITTSVNAVK